MVFKTRPLLRFYEDPGGCEKEGGATLHPVETTKTPTPSHAKLQAQHRGGRTSEREKLSPSLTATAALTIVTGCREPHHTSGTKEEGGDMEESAY